MLFPDDGITKGELASYYEMIAPVMVPHMRNRPVTMERYHRGIGAPGFFQKDVSKGFPDWLQRVEVPKKDGDGPSRARDRRPVASLARQSELHHATRVDVANAGLVPPGHLRLRSRPVRGASRAAARCRVASPRLSDGTGSSKLVEDVRVEGISYRRSA